VTDQQQRALACGPVERIQRLTRLKAPRKGLVQLERGALTRVHLGHRQLRGFARPSLRAGQGGSEARAHPRESATGDFGLSAAALGKTPRGVRARAVRLGVGVTKQPELAGRGHGLLRA